MQQRYISPGTINGTLIRLPEVLEAFWSEYPLSDGDMEISCLK
ncbi:hypothetical protein [Chitinophaga dinghuensis]|nr:hypothetical protein [Chitinophaga dinghuensis]